MNNNENKIIVFLPGSRLREVQSLMPYFQLAYDKLLTNYSDFVIFIPTLPHLKSELIQFTKNWKLKVIITNEIDEINKLYNLSSIALVCSGTASLEIAKRNIPQLVIYKLNIFTEIIAKLFIKVKFANILNIIDSQMIIPEITNFKLKKNIFLKLFDELMVGNKNKLQIKEINRVLKDVHGQSPPYEIACKRILTYLD